MAAENTLPVLLLVLTLGLLIPELLKKFRLPFVTFIILAGAIFGPNGFDYVQTNEIIDFFGFLGMTFLMLMAGLETDISTVSKSKRKILVMALLNGFIPFLFGLAITKSFGYSWISSILVGIIFISSSVAIIVTSLNGNRSINKKTAQLILSAVMISDIISLVLLGFVLQNISKITNLPLPIYFLILIASIPALFYFVPKISNYALKKRFSQDKGYERQLRYLLIVLIATLAYFSLLGVHPILASFLSGLSLSGIIRKDKSNLLYTKLHTLGYGLFVPVFFFIVGMELDISLLSHFDISNLVTISLILGLILSKMVSGYIAGRLVRFSKKDSLLFGSISITQLTTTLAVTYSASSLGILDSTLVTSIIILAVITTFLGPILASYISSRK